MPIVEMKHLSKKNVSTLYNHAVKKRPNSDSIIAFPIKTVIYTIENNGLWVIFGIFEKVSYRDIL